ncbi:MAG: HEAT repeat domain-containing protein [bacterium]
MLAAIPDQPGVLINIHRGIFPATGAITLLGQRATPALRKGLLGNTNASVRWRSAQVLTQLRDSSALPELHQALEDWNGNVRHQVLAALAYLGNAYSVPLILKRLADPQESVTNRRAALLALGKIGDGQAASAIEAQYTKAKDQPGVRLAAVTALWDLRRHVAASRLSKLLHRALADEDPWVVRRAAIGCGILKDRTALPALDRLLGGKQYMLRNVAAYVIGQIGDAKGIAILVRALPRVRSGRLLNNISFALQRLKSPNLWKYLKGLLTHRQAFIRLNGAFTVGEMQLPQARPLLVKLFADPNRLVRIQAVIALAKLGDKGAVPALEGMTKGLNEAYRQLALRALLYLSPAKRHRDQYFKLAAKNGTARDAALVLAARKDPRAAPLLYAIVRQRSDSQAWRAAKTLPSPLLTRLLQAQLRQAVARNDLRLIPQLLKYLGPNRLRQLDRQLVGLLYRNWSQLQTHHVPHRAAMLAVLRVLGQSGNTQLRTWLSYYLNHRDYQVRMEAHLALARLGDPKSLKTLVTALRNAADNRRPYLVSLLGQLPAKTIRQSLVPLLKRMDPYLELAVGAALHYGGEVRNKQLLLGLRSGQALVRRRARFYLSRNLDQQRLLQLRQTRQVEGDAIAKAELDRIIRSHAPEQDVFRDFTPREVVLY